MSWSIYMFTCDITGKSYIGLTSKTKEGRWRKHVIASKKTGYHFHNAIQKYPEDSWIKEYLCQDITTIEKAYELEKYYIALYDTCSNGYNTTLGGEGGSSWYDILLEVEKLKLKERRSVISRKAFNTPVYCFYNPEKNIHEETCVVDMVKKYNLLDRHIRDVALGTSRYHKGWFLWQGPDAEYSTKKLHSFIHEVHGIVRMSVDDMAKYLGIRHSQLHDVLTGRRNHTHGWKKFTIEQGRK